MYAKTILFRRYSLFDKQWLIYQVCLCIWENRICTISALSISLTFDKARPTTNKELTLQGYNEFRIVNILQILQSL
jgi:hypothetical protein